MALFDKPSSYVPRGDWILRPGDRALKVILDVITQIEVIALASKQLGLFSGGGGDWGSMECAQFDAEARFPVGKIFGARMVRRPILGMKIGFYPKVDVASDPDFLEFDSTDITGIMRDAALSMFVIYFDSHEEAIEAAFGSDKQRHPPVTNFARYVRNSGAHAGRVAIRNPNAPPASWRGLTIEARHHRQPLLGIGGLEIGDLLLLIKDFTEELDAHGVANPFA